MSIHQVGVWYVFSCQSYVDDGKRRVKRTHHQREHKPKWVVNDNRFGKVFHRKPSPDRLIRFRLMVGIVNASPLTNATNDNKNPLTQLSGI